MQNYLLSGIYVGRNLDKFVLMIQHYRLKRQDLY